MMEFSVIMQGHERKYNLEHIIKAVFFGAQLFFHDKEKENKVISKWNGKNAETQILLHGQHVIGSFSMQEDAYFLSKDPYVIARSFLNAAQQFYSPRLPWGILTGVRPAKTAARMLREGLSVRQVSNIFQEELLVSPEKTALMLQAAEKELSIQKSQLPNGCSLYIGIPFCPTRCAYCSFISKTYTDERVLSAFLEQLAEEIAATGNAIRRNGFVVDSIYFGGGTPTTLNVLQLQGVLEELKSQIDLSEVREFTVEAGRPDTITEEKLCLLKEYGVDRISINPQTLHSETLVKIGRAHSVEQFFDAYRLARKIGFHAVNTDLIAGLPDESLDDFRKTVEEIIKLEPENVTVHTLALKRASRLNQEHTDMSSEESEVSKMLSLASAALKGNGYAPYYLYRQKNILDNLENVGYSKPGYESIYNVYMMEELQTTLAAGGGGITKLVDPLTKKITRIPNPKLAEEYLRQKNIILNRKKEISR